MGTRSDIIVHLSNGRWKRVYCHWDGYLSHNGEILFEHYNSQKKAENLVSLGDISSLAEKCTKPKGHSFNNRKEGYTVYYGRDRGENGTEGIEGDSLAAVWPEKNTWTEFTYVWDGKWWVGDPDQGSQTLIDLGDALSGKSEIHPAVKVPFIGTIGQH